ncbi:hypothetical protein [Virgibacillus sediminis]|uniref:Uncharacterized protein n=1 Tax=Virgibacillus sediminis TaxID=202260 RepID=A0ABV7A504_9BACI
MGKVNDHGTKKWTSLMMPEHYSVVISDMGGEGIQRETHFR